jgi:hypothetical protein
MVRWDAGSANGALNFNRIRQAKSPDPLTTPPILSGGLHRGVCGPLLRGEEFLDFAHRARAFHPQGFHDLKFEFGEFRQRHFSKELRLFVKLACMWFSSNSFFEHTVTLILFRKSASGGWIE